jgi:hypothetical protein
VEFKVTRNNNCVRFENWEDFLEERIEFPKKSKNVLVFVTYNLVNEAKILLSYLDTQKSEFDILVIDNHSEIKSWDDLKFNNSRFNLIRTSDNIGGSGGYAIALEWCIQREYEYILVTEDDAFPGQPNLVDEMFHNASQNSYVTVRYMNEDCNSFSFHFTIYPLRLIENIGVPDPSFFMIKDDFEFLKRQIIGNKKLEIFEDNLDKFWYTHPTYKAKKNIWTEYFDSRNGLFVDEAYSNFIRQLFNLFIKIPYCWSRVLYDFNFSSLRSIHYAIIDYFLNRRTYNLNKKRRIQIQSYRLSLLQLTNQPKFLRIEEVLAENHSLNFSSYLKKSRNQKIGFGQLIKLLFARTQLVLAGNYLTLSHPLFMLSDKIIFVESIVENNNEDMFVTVEWINTKYLRKLRLLLTLILSALNIILIIPFIALRRLLNSLY